MLIASPQNLRGHLAILMVLYLLNSLSNVFYNRPFSFQHHAGSSIVSPSVMLNFIVAEVFQVVVFRLDNFVNEGKFNRKVTRFASA